MENKELTPERITELYCESFNAMVGRLREAPKHVPDTVITFARSIEREVLASRAGADVSGLTRYSAASESQGESREGMEVDNAFGQYYKVGDVEQLFAASNAPKQPDPNLKNGFPYHEGLDIKAVLYTDVINDKQVCRDDLWLATTEALNALRVPVEPVAAAPAAPLPEQPHEPTKAALDIEQMLAQYHKEVWDMAVSDKPDYDYAGRETAKKLVAAIGALAAAAAPAPAQTAQALPEGAMQLADLILADPAGGSLVISSELTTEADGAMRFTTTNPTTGARFGVYLGISELTADPRVPAQTGTCVSAAPLPVATQQPKLIETLKFALQDALGFAELVESYSKPDVEMFKHELRNDSELAQRRINVALQAIEDADVALPVATPQGEKSAAQHAWEKLALPVAAQTEQPTRDNCKLCLGAKGGVPGNENVIGGIVVCDYCTSTLMDMKASGWFGEVAAPELAQDKLTEALIEIRDESARGNYERIYSLAVDAILAAKEQDQKGGAA